MQTAYTIGIVFANIHVTNVSQDAADADVCWIFFRRRDAFHHWHVFHHLSAFPYQIALSDRIAFHLHVVFRLWNAVLHLFLEASEFYWCIFLQKWEILLS